MLQLKRSVILNTNQVNLNKPGTGQNSASPLMTNINKKYVRQFFICMYVTHFFLEILLIWSAKTEREAADELLTATTEANDTYK